MKRWAAAIGGLSVLVIVNMAAYGHDAQLDLSSSGRFSLSPESRALARSVKAPLEIRAFLNSGGAAARDARFLLARYHELNSRITSQVIDPDTHPGEARRFGISQYSTVVLTSGGRRVDAPDAEELEISTAILRLLRGASPTVCVLTGHGEPKLDDQSPDGMSAVGDLLTHNAFTVRSVDLTVGRGPVPNDCSTVVELGARDAYLPSETSALLDYLRASGRLLILATPISQADPNPLISPWGVSFAGGLVLDQDRSQGLDASNVIVQDLPSANPVDQGVASLHFPATGGLITNPAPRDGLAVSTLGRTSGNSFIETHPDTETVFDSQDIRGPVVVAAASDDSKVQPGAEHRIPGLTGPGVARTRLFVTGSNTWALNRFLNDLGNRRLFVNAIDWLTEQEQLVVATSRPNPSRPLPLTAERQTRILVITDGILPALIVIAGCVPWWIRRRRH